MPSDTTSYRKYIRSMSKSNMAQFKRSYRTFAGIEDLIKSRPSDDTVYDYIVSWVTDSKASADKISIDLVRMKSYLEYRRLDTSLPDIGQSMNFQDASGGLHPFTIISFRRILRESHVPWSQTVPGSYIKRNAHKRSRTAQAKRSPHRPGQD